MMCNFHSLLSSVDEFSGNKNSTLVPTPPPFISFSGICKNLADICDQPQPGYFLKGGREGTLGMRLIIYRVKLVY